MRAVQREILIGGEGDDLRVAVLEDGALVEYYEQAAEAQRAAGNIYKGRVENVLPGMQAAFVSIGLDRNAYLYVADAYPVPEEDEEEPELRQLVRRRRSIGELLRPGQEVIVQVAKEPVGTKGARVTRTITLPGRYLVLVPGGSHVAVSQRLTDERERERLRALARGIKPRGAGLIVRTAAEGRSAEDLEADVAALRRLWARIRQRARRTPAPSLLHSDQDVVYRVLRDALSPEVVAIRADAPREHARALELVRLFAPELEGRLSLEPPGSPPLFEARGVDQELQRALARRVWLPNGAYIVIDQTEALTAVDVNTGRFVGTTASLEETVLAANLEAAREIARLIRLRDIGGIIVIDFIDMARDAHRLLVMRELEEHLRRDRTRSAVLGITHLGLVEVTRRKRRQSLPELLTRTCPTCGGSGRVITETAAGRQARRQLRKLARKTQSEAFLVEAHPSVAAVLIGPGGSHLRELEKETGKSIFVRGSEACQVGELRLVARGSRQDMMAQALPVQAGQVLELRVEEPHVSHSEDGIARLEGYVIDIEGAASRVGQKVKVEITKAFRTYAKARIVV